MLRSGNSAFHQHNLSEMDINAYIMSRGAKMRFFALAPRNQKLGVRERNLKRRSSA